MTTQGVRLRPADGSSPSRPATDRLDEWAGRAAATAGRCAEAVELARALTGVADQPGSGHTRERWELLASLAVGDLSVARVAEAHLDALAILAEAAAGIDDRGMVWGVYAAEGPGLRLDATLEREGWFLSGVKPWCSAADQVDRALVTAHTSEGRRLFAIDLHSPTVTQGADQWVARGLADVTSTSIVLDRTPATPVGETGWYLTRPGFAWGGIGVAACWFGGLVGVARRLWQAGESREPDQIAALHLGVTDLQVTASRLALADAAALVDGGSADGPAGAVLAERVRGIVCAAAEFVLSSAAHALGPAPLAVDEDHARRVSDLELYVRQHHAERDSARLGGLLWAQDGSPW